MAMKTTAQIKAEHPEWTDKQVIDEFYILMTKDMRSIRRKLRKMKKILETDPLCSKDDDSVYWSEMFGECDTLLDPDLNVDIDSLLIGDMKVEDVWVNYLDGARSKHTNKAKKKK